MKYDYKEEKMDCPVCGKKGAFVLRSLVYEVPPYGKTVLISGKCQSCGYRFTFTTPYEVKRGRVIEFKVEQPSDLNTLLYVGENTDIEIPEFDFQFLSSEYEPGFVTTIEGLLVKIKERLEPICEDEKCLNYIEKLNLGIKGDLKFTVKLIDKYGRSEIFSDRIALKDLQE